MLAFIKGVINMANRLNLGDIGRLVNDLQSEATKQNRQRNRKWSRAKRRETSVLRQSECTKRLEELEITAIELKKERDRNKAMIARIDIAKRKKADEKILGLIGNYLKN
jgi:transposase